MVRRKLLIVCAWLLLWQLLALLVRNEIVLVGPAETVLALGRMLPDADFWRAVGRSFLKICGGFVAGSAVGIGLAALAFRFRLLEEVLAPLVLLQKAIPVASFVILALIWFGNQNLSLFISFVVVFPMLYLNTLNGLKSTDAKLLEMAQVFRIPLFSKVRYIYLPTLMPFLLSGFQVALGMSWKSGVAAEVIGQPLETIGNGLYRAKIYLSTDEVFAWTVVIVLLSWLFEQAFLRLFSLISRRSAGKMMGSKATAQEGGV